MRLVTAGAAALSLCAAGCAVQSQGAYSYATGYASFQDLANASTDIVVCTIQGDPVAEPATMPEVRDQ